MQIQTEGNSPSLRPQLGVGWNRALPAPFSFGNGVLPDGVNDKLTIPGLIGTTYNNRKTFTFEFWVNLTTVMSQNGNFLGLNFSDGANIYIEYIINGGNFFRYIAQNGALTIDSRPTIVPGFDTLTGIHHIVVTVDMANLRINAYKDGIIVGNVALTAQATETANNPTISSVDLLFRASTALNRKIDEVRMYNRIISTQEITSNYNSGVGNNPTKSEGLVFWYDFTQAESDVALYPGGIPSGWTAGAWGIRDKTPNGNHAMQVNFAANNSTLGGAIQAF